MKKLMIVKTALVAAVMTVSGMSIPAQAIPTKCIEESWKYADRMSGTNDHFDPTWQFYAAQYQDENGCAVVPCNPDKEGCPPVDPIFG